MTIFISTYQDGTPIFALSKLSDDYFPISEEVHSKFLQNNAQGHQYKVINASAILFDEIFEEYTPQPVVTKPTLEQQQIAQLLLITAQQSQQISALQQEATTNG